MASKVINVLLVDDSPIALTLLKRMLSTVPDIQVVGTAKNGEEALTLIDQLQPDVICADLHMPRLNGLELTERVMAEKPRPILVTSISVQKDDPLNVFRLLEAGAVDVFPKPRGGWEAEYQQIAQALITKIRVVAGVVVFRRHRLPPVVRLEVNPLSVRKFSRIKVVVIGASTGGPQALHTLLSQLPANFPLPIICVQHIGEGFLQGLVEWLNTATPLPVKIATPGEFPQPSTVYFPREGVHLEFSSRGRFVESTAPPLQGHRPSVTVTFRSVARTFGAEAIGVLLSGMGQDGAEGLLEMAQHGAVTIAQNKETCVVFGMPQEAIKLNAAKYILPVEAIAPKIINILKSRT